MAGVPFPSPLVGEGGSNARSAFETGEGLALQKDCARIETPHPALRATFSHKGRRKKRTAIRISNSEIVIDTRPHSRGAMRPRYAIDFTPFVKRAQGKPGADCTRGRAQNAHE